MMIFGRDDHRDQDLLLSPTSLAPLRLILVPSVFSSAREPRYEDAENGSGTCQILVPENLGSRGKPAGTGTKLAPPEGGEQDPCHGKIWCPFHTENEGQSE